MKVSMIMARQRQQLRSDSLLLMRQLAGGTRQASYRLLRLLEGSSSRQLSRPLRGMWGRWQRGGTEERQQQRCSRVMKPQQQGIRKRKNSIQRNQVVSSYVGRESVDADIRLDYIMLRHQPQPPLTTRILPPLPTQAITSDNPPLTHRAIHTASEVIQLLQEQNNDLKSLIADMKQKLREQQAIISSLQAQIASRTSHSRQDSGNSRENTIIKQLKHLTPVKEQIVIETHPTFFSFSSQKKPVEIAQGHTSKSVVLGGGPEGQSKGLSGYGSTEVGKATSSVLAQEHLEGEVVWELQAMVREAEESLREIEVGVGVEKIIMTMNWNQQDESTSMEQERGDMQIGQLIGGLCRCVMQYRSKFDWLRGQLCVCLNELTRLCEVREENKQLYKIAQGLISHLVQQIN